MSMYGKPRLAGEQGGKSLTRQSETESCDVNRIMARYEKTGVITLSERQGLFIDVSEIGDFRQAVEHVRKGTELFGQLPAKVRAEFENDPARWLDFMADPANEARAKELGLIGEPEAPVAPPVAAPVAGEKPA